MGLLDVGRRRGIACFVGPGALTLHALCPLRQGQHGALHSTDGARTR